MYKVKINVPEYLEHKEFISPDIMVVSDFLQDKVTELQSKGLTLWSIEVLPTSIQYLGEYTE